MSSIMRARSALTGVMRWMTLSQRLDEQDRKLDAIYASAERTRKYLLWTLIITVAVIILPLIGLAFAIPSFLSIYTGNGL